MMSKLKNIFQRKENKYSMNLNTYKQLREQLAEYLEEDEYGLHTILSVYYDTNSFEVIKRSIEKPNYREKFRLRSYGIPTEDSLVFLEMKKKVKVIVYKRRIQVPYSQALTYYYKNLELHLQSNHEKQIKKEMDWLVETKKLFPRVLVAYDRIALKSDIEGLEEFRVTFDFNIRHRKEGLDLRVGEHGIRVAPEMDVLMEVKALGSYPVWFSQILSQLSIHKVSFSKYSQTYQRFLVTKEEELNV